MTWLDGLVKANYKFSLHKNVWVEKNYTHAGRCATCDSLCNLPKFVKSIKCDKAAHR